MGERIRELLLHAKEIEISPDAEVLLLFAARAEHLTRVVRPALERGATVVCDRFTDATYAYQGGGHGVPIERIATLESWTQGELRPDLTLLFDVPVDVGLVRAASRHSAPDRFEGREGGFLERVRHAYLERAHREPQRFRVVDASRSVSEVEAALTRALQEFCHGKS